MPLRPYQKAAVDAVRETLSRSRSTIVVMPTGSGKTECFVEVIRRWPGSVLVLAHRDELISQAVNRIKQMLDEIPGVEKAERHATDERIVVASVQSLRTARLDRLSTDRFSLIVIDEAHHAVASTYRAVVEHFTTAHILGVTATPDRADARSMGEVFESVAFNYTLIDAINDGWLVRPLLSRVVIDSVHLESVKVRAGDYATNELEEQMGTDDALHAIARPLLEQSSGRQTIVYMPGVSSAHKLQEILYQYKAGSAQVVDGSTPHKDRRELLKAHDRSDYPILVNCMVLTEGYDSPTVSCVAVARPTRSRSLYAQMLGRGLRPVPGKRDCLVLDFVGASNRLDLVGPEDVLGCEESTDVLREIKAATSTQTTTPIDILAEVDLARRTVEYRIEQEKELLKRRAQADMPVCVREAWIGLGLRQSDLSAQETYGIRPATPKQLMALESFGVETETDTIITLGVASKLIGAFIDHIERELATPKQRRVLRRYGLDSDGVTKKRASELISQLAANRWRGL